MKILPCVLTSVLATAFFLRVLCAQESKEEATITIAVPAAVKAALTREAAGGSIIDLRREGDAEAATYEATIRIGRHEYSVIVESNGSFIRKELKEMEDTGRKVRLQDLPEIVRTVLAKEATGGEVQSIHEQKATFTVVVTVKEQPYTIVIDADGTLIRKEPGEESGADTAVSAPGFSGAPRFTQPEKAVKAPPVK